MQWEQKRINETEEKKNTLTKNNQWVQQWTRIFTARTLDYRDLRKFYV